MVIDGRSIVKGNEKAWLRMMLDDDSIVQQMGLPLNMTDAQKDEAVEVIAEKYPEFVYGEQVQETDVTRSSNSGQKIMSEDELVEGTNYKISFPNGNVVYASLDSINIGTYLCNDYIFKYIKGCRGLVDSSNLGNGLFPLPGSLINMTDIEVY